MKSTRLLQEFENIGILGEPLDLTGTDYYLHPQAAPAGGILVVDEDKVIPQVIKKITSSIAKAIASGNVGDLQRITTPAIVHHGIS